MTVPDWTLWGHLRGRYVAPRPRRMLALDGGGIRGLLSLRVLKRMEALLAQHYYPNDAAAADGFRLCQFFDYIGGTSTGAIIAAGLARGMSVADIETFYSDFGKSVFDRRSLFERWKSLYEDGPLGRKLQEAFTSNGHINTLEPHYLQTLLLVVTKNLSTDSAWPISSNPSAKYNDPMRADCNLRIPMWKIVRASTAAPVYFPPEVVAWDPTNPDKHFVFVDGGTTPNNCPAFLMVRMATSPAYRLGWPSGESRLLVVSVGTGAAPVAGTTVDDPETNLLSAAQTTLKGLMHQAEIEQDLNCRIFGRCSYGHELDREILDLIPRRDGVVIPLGEDLGRAFLYCRYDVELTDSGLRALGVSGIQAKDVGGLDNVGAMPALEVIGDALGRKISLSHFGAFTDTPLWP